MLTRVISCGYRPAPTMSTMRDQIGRPGRARSAPASSSPAWSRSSPGCWCRCCSAPSPPARRCSWPSSRRPAWSWSRPAFVLLARRLRASHDALWALARRDELTGVGNYRSLHERLAEEIARHRRRSREFALILLDLDGFKQVNERFGHLDGDRLLAEIGAALSDEVRAEDSVFRQGGDEFAVIVPEANAEEAEEVAARLRERIARRGFGSDEPAGLRRHRLRDVPRRRRQRRDLLGFADADLFAAKRGGGGEVREGRRRGERGGEGSGRRGRTPGRSASRAERGLEPSARPGGRRDRVSGREACQCSCRARTRSRAHAGARGSTRTRGRRARSGRAGPRSGALVGHQVDLGPLSFQPDVFGSGSAAARPARSRAARTTRPRGSISAGCSSIPTWWSIRTEVTPGPQGPRSRSTR